MPQPLHFALNHMAVPDRSVRALVAMARALGLDAIELRNDIEGQAIADGTPAAEIRQLCEEAGVRVLSINALQRFNDWTAARAEEAQALAAYARDCGAEALVLCPVNDRGWTVPAGSLYAALQGLAPILAGAGIGGLVEPLGFEECSLRTKAEAVEAIDALGLGDRFRLVHDTFHHHLSGDPRMFPAHTGLVHISGVEDRATPLPSIRDGHRVLVGDADILGNARQIAALRRAGYAGPFSFEPFARGFADAEIGASIRHLERAVAEAA